MTSTVEKVARAIYECWTNDWPYDKDIKGSWDRLPDSWHNMYYVKAQAAIDAIMPNYKTLANALKIIAEHKEQGSTYGSGLEYSHCAKIAQKALQGIL